jgi:predicted PurR-regulated permease PerM
LMMFFISMLIAIFVDAVTDALEKKLRLKRSLAFVLALCLSGLALFALGALIVPPVIEQTRQLVSRLPEYIAGWGKSIDELAARFPALAPLVGADQQQQLINTAIDEAKGFAGGLVPKVFSLLHVFIDLAAMVVMSIYLAVNPELYRALLVGLFPRARRESARGVLNAIGATLRAWTLAQLAAMAVLGALTAVLLWMLGVPYWLAFGVFSGAAAIVPFFGTLVSTVLPALFVLGGEGGPFKAFLVVMVGVVVHLIEGNLVAPLIFQRSVHIPPVLSIMAVLIVGSVLGPVGLLIAVPTLAVVMVLVRKLLIEETYGDQRNEGEIPTENPPHAD